MRIGLLQLQLKPLCTAAARLNSVRPVIASRLQTRRQGEASPLGAVWPIPRETISRESQPLVRLLSGCLAPNLDFSSPHACCCLPRSGIRQAVALHFGRGSCVLALRCGVPVPAAPSRLSKLEVRSSPLIPAMARPTRPACACTAPLSPRNGPSTLSGMRSLQARSRKEAGAEHSCRWILSLRGSCLQGVACSGELGSAAARPLYAPLSSAQAFSLRRGWSPSSDSQSSASGRSTRRMRRSMRTSVRTRCGRVPARHSRRCAHCMT